MHNTLRFILFVSVLTCTAAFAFSQPNVSTKSGANSASFGTFANRYDNFLDPLFWNENPNRRPSVFTGINDNGLNIGFSGCFFGDVYTAFLFQEKITNYKWWPENMTNESWTILVGWKDFMLKAGYYDFCYSGGKGTAQPYLFGGGKWQLHQNELRVAVGADVAMQFGSGNKMDVFQPQGHLLVAFGKNSNNTFRLSYRIMGTYAAAHNVTDVSATPLFHELTFCYYKLWQLLPQVNMGIKPNFFARLNAINPTATLHNFVPKKDAFELYFAVPLVLEFYPSEQRFVSFITALQIDVYYASFDHLGYKGMGGNNYHGWVPGIGMGLGCKFSFAPKVFMQLGFAYIARPELTSDLSQHEYSLKPLSIQSLLDAPLTLSVQVAF